MAGRLTAPGLSPDLAKTKHVNCVAQLVAEHTPYYDMPVSVHVVRSREISYNALPIGVIVVSEGFLDLVHSDDELACLMGHELAHVTQRHGRRELTCRGPRIRAQMAFRELGGDGDPDTRELEELAEDMYERDVRGRNDVYEMEADQLGTVYACRAGYDGQAMITLLERLQERIPPKQDPEDATHWLPMTLKRRIGSLRQEVAR